MMSAGLTNAPASLQRYINKIVVKTLDIFIIINLDDIFIYSDNDRDGHVAAVKCILEQHKKFLLYANPKNCQFYRTRFDFLAIWYPQKEL